MRTHAWSLPWYVFGGSSSGRMFGCSSVGSGSSVVSTIVTVGLVLVDVASVAVVVGAVVEGVAVVDFGTTFGFSDVVVIGFVVELAVVLVVGVGSEVCTVVAAGDRVVTGLSAPPSAKCWTAGTEPAAIRAAAPRATAVRVNFTVNRSLSFKKQTRCFATFCQTGTYDMQCE